MALEIGIRVQIVSVSYACLTYFSSVMYLLYYNRGHTYPHAASSN